MRSFILKKLQRKTIAMQSKPGATTVAPHTAPRPNLPRGSAYAQEQCELFGKLSAELRLLIYHAALADSHRLLHILHITPRYGPPKQMGHWRCEDMDSPYPTWQHRCFGCWVEGDTRYFRNASHTNSDLLSLLLTCRSIYLEAVEVLYADNHFSFRGARGVFTFQSLIAPSNWDALKHVHLSTTFLTPMKFWMKGALPPENYNHWENGCRALVSLPRLNLLYIDIIVWGRLSYYAPSPVDNESLLFILSALKPVKARKFQVELNIRLPDQVMTSLEPIPFSILHHERPYDGETFPL